MFQGKERMRDPIPLLQHEELLPLGSKERIINGGSQAGRAEAGCLFKVTDILRLGALFANDHCNYATNQYRPMPGYPTYPLLKDNN